MLGEGAGAEPFLHVESDSPSFEPSAGDFEGSSCLYGFKAAPRCVLVNFKSHVLPPQRAILVISPIFS